MSATLTGVMDSSISLTGVMDVTVSLSGVIDGFLAPDFGDYSLDFSQAMNSFYLGAL